MARPLLKPLSIVSPRWTACWSSLVLHGFLWALVVSLPRLALAQNVTSGTVVYGTGQSGTNWAGGDIAAGATLRLDPGATVSGGLGGGGGTFQFNSTGALTIATDYFGSDTVGNGLFSVTNTGTVTATSALYDPQWPVSFRTVSVSAGQLRLVWATDGTTLTNYNISANNPLTITGGSVVNGDGIVNSPDFSNATATVSGGTWTNSNSLCVGGYFLAGTGAIGGNGTLNVTGGSVSNVDGIIGYVVGSTGTANISAGTWASGHDLFVGWSGTGTLNVSGGSVTNANGYIGFDNGGVGTATVSSGTWATSGDLWVGYTDPEDPSYVNGAGTLTMTGGLVTVSGVLNRGTLGTINLNAGGTLQIGTGGAGSGISVGALTNNGTLAFNQSDNYTYSDAISGSGAVTKTGTGTLTLNGNNSFTGGVTISGGTLAMGSSTALGSGGSLAVNGGTLDLRGRDLTVNALSGSSSGTIQSGVAGFVTLTATAATNSTFAGSIINGSGTVGFTKSGNGTLTLSGSNSYTRGTTISGGTLQIGNGSTTGSIAGNVVNNATLAFNRSNALTYSGTISGSGGLTKLGAGTLTLTGSSTYTGGTTISSGTLQIGNNGTTGSINGNVVNNATLAFNRSNASIFSGVISGTGGLAISGSGAVTLTGNNTYTGVTTIQRTLTSGSVALQIGTGGTTGVITGNVLFSGTYPNDYSLVFNRSDDLTYSGTITGSGVGGMLKLGAGTLTLTGSFNTGAGIKVSEGALQMGDGGTTGVVVNRIQLENNSSFIYNRSDDVTRRGTLSGTGTLIKRGAGTLTLGISNNYNGGTTISGGALATGTSGALPTGGAVTITSGTLDLGGYSATIGTLSGSSGATITSGSAGSITLTSTSATNSTYAGTITNGLGAMAFTKQGAGTLTLSGTSSYTGATTISGGVLAFGVSNALSDSTAVTVAGGGLDIGSYTDTVASFTITSGSLFGSGKLTAATYALGGGTVTGNLGGGSMTVTANSNLNGTADGTSVSLNAGSLALGSAGRFTSIQVALTGSSGGSMSLGGSESVGSLAGGFNVSLGSATLNTGNDNTSTTYSGIVSGSGGLTKAGTGTFTLSGSSSYTGATAVNGGRLLVNGQLGNTAVAVNASGLLGGSGTILGGVTVNSSGTLSPGNSPGVLTVGSLSLLAGSHTLMEITGTSASLYDQIVGTGSGGLTYGGNLDLVLSGSYADQTTFHLFSNFSSSGGDFAAVGLDATGEYAGLTFSDSDHVGGVWTSTWTENHQRLVFSTGTGDLVVVPEPSTYAMGLVGLACGGWQMLRRRRLRQAPTLAA